jgi:hypothetical protein
MKKTITFLLVLVALSISSSISAQILNTKLQVTVRNDLGIIVEGATVTLFKTMDDYEGETNPVKSAVTDDKGRVLFYELEPRSYYMLVRKGELNNIGRGEQTSKLVEKKKNMLNVVIE